MTGFNQKVQPVTIVSCKKRSFSTFQEAAFHFHPCCSSSTENNTETLYAVAWCRQAASLIWPRCIIDVLNEGPGFMTVLGNDQENGLEQQQRGNTDSLCSGRAVGCHCNMLTEHTGFREHCPICHNSFPKSNSTTKSKKTASWVIYYLDWKPFFYSLDYILWAYTLFSWFYAYLT